MKYQKNMSILLSFLRIKINKIDDRSQITQVIFNLIWKCARVFVDQK